MKETQRNVEIRRGTWKKQRSPIRGLKYIVICSVGDRVWKVECPTFAEANDVRVSWMTRGKLP